jgi:hypothetical protein
VKASSRQSLHRSVRQNIRACCWQCVTDVVVGCKGFAVCHFVLWQVPALKAFAGCLLSCSTARMMLDHMLDSTHIQANEVYELQLLKRLWTCSYSCACPTCSIQDIVSHMSAAFLVSRCRTAQSNNQHFEGQKGTPH